MEDPRITTQGPAADILNQPGGPMIAPGWRRRGLKLIPSYLKGATATVRWAPQLSTARVRLIGQWRMGNLLPVGGDGLAAAKVRQGATPIISTRGGDFIPWTWVHRSGWILPDAFQQRCSEDHHGAFKHSHGPLDVSATRFTGLRHGFVKQSRRCHIRFPSALRASPWVYTTVSAA
ncbi:hypothetical protein [Corynebacterium efficiens YS-314]|uniref:Uncharacterized protein n=1 Tax=Corynebacterium efficiens (strain DSM 44549 / YS-314 / AJ 12310 / JCM 11189 / NBRC 100395) TaxID=196164 RepID=Q8FSX3_COREF|nr:hypothetical protein [Corynebacterium efficiens YS-314]